MQRVVVWFLEHRVVLGRISIVTALLPFYLGTIPRLFAPMVFTAIVLFLTLNWTKIHEFWKKFSSAHYWLKIQYFWFGVGFAIVSFLVYPVLKNIVGEFIYLGLFYVFIYYIWFNKINTKLAEMGDSIILKGHTKDKSRDLDFEPYLIPLILSLLVIFLITSLQSLIITRAESIFTFDVIHWYIPLAILIIHYIVDLLFMEQIQWHPEGGVTEWETVDVPQLPRIDQPFMLAEYFDLAGRLDKPDHRAMQLIEDNLVFLMEHSEELPYFKFHINFTRAMGNWGRAARQYLHLFLAIIFASISKYRLVGLIPNYKRRLFYSALQVVPMAGAMNIHWRELFEYEVNHRIEASTLDWVFGSRYIKKKYAYEWVLCWEGKIYKGKEGYYEAAKIIEKMYHVRPELDGWALDLWNIILEYAKVFIGESSRKLLTEQVGHYERLLYIARGNTLEEFTRQKQAYRQSLSQPSTNRLVYIPEETDTTDYTDEEKREMIEAYLDQDAEAEQVQSIGSYFRDWFGTIIDRIRNLNITGIIRILAVIGLFTVNIGVIYIIDIMFLEGAGIFLIAMEIVLLFIFSITPSNADLKFSDQETAKSEILSSRTFTYSAVKVNTSETSQGTAILFYAFTLLLVYQVLFGS